MNPGRRDSASTTSSSSYSPPPNPEVLKTNATHYEFTTGIPLKFWLRTASTLLKHGKSFASDSSIDETYVLYLRYLDLFAFKLYKHPDTKKFKSEYQRSKSSENAKIYKDYLILKKKMPDVMSETEKLYKSLKENYDSFLESEKRKRQLIELQEARFAKMKLQQQLEQKRRKSSSASNGSFNIELSKAEEEALSKKIRTLSSSSLSSSEAQHLSNLPNYPSLPVFDESLETPEHPNNINGSNFKAQPIHHTLEPSVSPIVPLHNSILAPPTSGTSSILADIPVVPPLPPNPPTTVPTAPTLPNKPTTTTKKEVFHKTVNFTEGGSPLRTIFLPAQLIDKFLLIAKRNTRKKLETCGILCGKLNRNAFFITHLVIPEQDNTPNTCTTKNEEKMFDVIDNLDLFVLGWIHTHPTQSCFLSSVDLHTQNSYQIMLNEAIAIVCSPDEKFTKKLGIFRLTDPPGVPTITNCNLTGFHPHQNDKDLYGECHRQSGDVKSGHVVIKNELPFEIKDLRG
ncbi:unnamed protein product [Ambrosiozyma monospora]|uniref:Regulator of free ubiquitin chains 1 n=1 Tax=Ambrosiozyma monospora TaxID=43982 RepID=A0A9W6YTW8_AMBMO|nr:unnamed protein product [Ambrosiozyma monospora]